MKIAKAELIKLARAVGTDAGDKAPLESIKIGETFNDDMKKLTDVAWASTGLAALKKAGWDAAEGPLFDEVQKVYAKAFFAAMFKRLKKVL